MSYFPYEVPVTGTYRIFQNTGAILTLPTSHGWDTAVPNNAWWDVPLTRGTLLACPPSMMIVPPR